LVKNINDTCKVKKYQILLVKTNKDIII